MPELPSGTVTFLFTDIEGSTRLLKQVRERYGEVLAEQQRLLREAVADAGGREIDTQGDAFFFAFATAKEALTAALAGQRALAAHEWPEGVDVRVRMGIHTGEPLVGEERYVGLGVHRAARICAAGHGGQVLVSEATRAVSEEELPEGVALRDLGEHALKDLDRPERLYQLLAPDLQPDFPPLRAGQEGTAFAGREGELAQAAREAVARPHHRRRMLFLAAVGGTVAAAIAVSILALGQRGGSSDPVSVQPNSVAVIDPDSNEVVADVPVGTTPSHVVVGEGAVWVLNSTDFTVSRINPETMDVRTIGTGTTPSDLAVGGGAVWLVTPLPDIEVFRLDPVSNLVERTIKLYAGRIPSIGSSQSYVAFDQGALWVSNSSADVVWRIDPVAKAITETIPRPTAESSPGEGIAVGEGAVWVNGPVTRIDPATNAPTTLDLPHSLLGGIAAGEGGVWTVDSFQGTLWRIDPQRVVGVRTINVGRVPLGVAVGVGSVWVANSEDGTVSRIDPTTNEVVKTIEVGNTPRGVAVGEGFVWVAVS